MANPTTRGSTPPQSGRIGQQSPTDAVVLQGYADTAFPSIAFTNQLAINLTEKTLAYYDANGAWQSILGGSGVQSYYGPVGPTTGVQAGDRWFNTATLIWSIWNPTFGAWMPGNASFSTSAPNAPVIGQPWFNVATGVQTYWDGTNWVAGSAPTAPGAYTGALPAAATKGSTWTDSAGIAWTCITAYTSGGSMANWQRVVYKVDPLATLITGQVIVTGEFSASPPMPQTQVAVTTGLIWLDTQAGTNLGKFFIYDGAAWQQVYAPNTIDLCLALAFTQANIKFSNTDTVLAYGPNADIVIPLTYVPVSGSEHVYYNGTPLRTTDWWRTDNALIIPAENWFRAGRTAWVDYAYYVAPPRTAPFLVGVTTVNGDNTSIALPAGTLAGDLLYLAICARDIAACTDPRFDAGYSPAGAQGIWMGRANGTSGDVAITLSSTSGPGDGAAALMVIRGTPLLVTGEADSVAPGAPFTPSLPSGSFSLGLTGITAGSGLISGTLTGDSLGHWTTAATSHGGGPGKCSVLLSYATGMPSGTYSTTGSSISGGARVVGIA